MDQQDQFSEEDQINSQISQSFDTPPKKKRWWIWLILSIVIIAAGVLIYTFYFKVDPPQYPHVHLYDNPCYDKYPEIEDIENSPVVSKTAPTGTCKVVEELEGSNPIEAVEYWFNQSGCFSTEYIEKHIGNITIFHQTEHEILLAYDVEINSEVIGRAKEEDTGANSGRFRLTSNGEGRYLPESVYGPLREYDVKVTRQEVFNSVKGLDILNDKTSHLISSIRLENNDSFSQSYGYEYDSRGLMWEVPTLACELVLYVDPASGEIYQRKRICM